jgi:hypothetical protein
MSNVVELFPKIQLSERDAVIKCLRSCVHNYRNVIEGWDDLPEHMVEALEMCIDGCNLLITQLKQKEAK